MSYLEVNNDLSKSTGAVVVSVFIFGNMLYCVNLGDSRAVLSRNGKAINLSLDHKASLASEKERVKEMGGHIYADRVAGKLAVSRAFGDFEIKFVLHANG